MQILFAANRPSQQDDARTNGPSCFDYAPAWDLPAADNHMPMHDEHPNELGIQIAKPVPGLLAPQDRDLPFFLEEFEEQFDLPVEA